MNSVHFYIWFPAVFPQAKLSVASQWNGVNYSNNIIKSIAKRVQMICIKLEYQTRQWKSALRLIILLGYYDNWYNIRIFKKSIRISHAGSYGTKFGINFKSLLLLLVYLWRRD